MLFVVIGLLSIAILFEINVLSNGHVATQVGKSQPKTSTLLQLTSDLKNRTKEYAVSKDHRLVPQLKKLARDRNNFVLNAIQANPQTVLANAFPQDLRKKLPPKAQELVEEHVDLEGTLEILHEDDFENFKSRNFYFLRQGDNRLSLHPVGDMPGVISGSKVRVTGLQLDRDIIFSTENTIEVLEAASTLVSGVQMTAVAFFDGGDLGSPPTLAEVDQLIFGDTDAFHQENSYGNISLAGDAFGPYTAATACPNTAEMIQIVDPDIFFPSYSRIIFVSSSCSTSSGTVGKVNIDTADGTVSVSISRVGWYTSGSFDPHYRQFVAAHEMGHNFGVMHANGWTCDPSCRSIEYYDPYDIMGGLPWPAGVALSHMNAGMKESLGWLASGSGMVEVTSETVITLNPLEDALASVRGVKVLRGGNQSSPMSWYYLEYRQPIGIDDNPAINAFLVSSPGILIHRRPNTTETWLFLDVGQDYVLRSGKVFCDPGSGVAILPTVATASGISVNVFLDVSCGNTDNDGFTDVVELYLGTDPNLACSVTTTVNDEPVDAWPPDFNDNQIVGIDDIFAVSGRFNLKVGDPGYSPRYELASQNGEIGIDDIFAVSGRFNETCLP